MRARQFLAMLFVSGLRANRRLRNGRSLRSYNDFAGAKRKWALRGRNHAEG